ncbi:MAG: phage major capsid protein [Actinomycetia bacterium]|nr:phage major capsid protein [Actinomycetes bacterium]
MTTRTTTTSAFAWRPDEKFFAANEVVDDALIMKTATKAGVVDGDMPVVRVAYLDDTDADYYDEASEIDETDPDLAEITVSTRKLAQLVRVSSEQYRLEETAEQLSGSVARALIRKADADYITGTDPVGLANIAGTVEAGSLGTDLDALVDLIATIESNGGKPSHIVVDPLAWASIRKIKWDTTDSNASLLGAGTLDVQKMLLGLPVIVNRFVGAHSGVVLDKEAVVSAIGPVSVAVSEHAGFSSDTVVLRAIWRIGWNIVRPNWVGSFDTEPGT